MKMLTSIEGIAEKFKRMFVEIVKERSLVLTMSISNEADEEKLDNIMSGNFDMKLYGYECAKEKIKEMKMVEESAGTEVYGCYFVLEISTVGYVIVEYFERTMKRFFSTDGCVMISYKNSVHQWKFNEEGLNKELLVLSEEMFNNHQEEIMEMIMDYRSAYVEEERRMFKEKYKEQLKGYGIKDVEFFEGNYISVHHLDGKVVKNVSKKAFVDIFANQ